MTEHNSNKLTNNQIGLIMNDIAETSKTIERLAMLMVEAEDVRASEAMRHSIESLTQRIGLLADFAAGRSRYAIPLYGTKVEDWMMPRAYHADIENNITITNSEHLHAAEG